jgi:hypothetical protein
MKTSILALAAAFATLLAASPASAQVIVGAPVTTYYAPAFSAAPTVSYYAPTAPITVARPVTSAFYAPAASYAAPATTAYYAPAAYAAPVTSYYAPAAYAAPVTSYYAPAAVAAPVVAAPYVAGRPAWVGGNIYGGYQPYVAGQPVRNTLRFLTP